MDQTPAAAPITTPAIPAIPASAAPSAAPSTAPGAAHGSRSTGLWNALFAIQAAGKLPGQSQTLAATAPAAPAPAAPRAPARPIGAIIVSLLVLAGLLAVAEAVGRDWSATAAAAAVCLVCALAWLLARRGRVVLAALLVLCITYAALLGALLSAPGGQLSLVYLPTLDLFVVPVLLAAAMLGGHRALLGAGLASVALVAACYFGMPTAPDLLRDWQVYGPGLSLARPLFLIIATALFSYLLDRRAVAI